MSTRHTSWIAPPGFRAGVLLVLVLHAVPAHSAPLARIEGDRVVTARKIQFVTGRVTLTPESAPVVAQLATLMKANETNDFVVETHTDATGDEAQNVSLSEARANAIIDALVRRGVDRERLRGVGRGSADPIVAARSAEAWRNRRVVIAVVSRTGAVPVALAAPAPPAAAPSRPIIVGVLDDDLVAIAPRFAIVDEPSSETFNNAEDLAPPRFVAFLGIRPIVGLIDTDDTELLVPAFGVRAPAPNIQAIDD